MHWNENISTIVRPMSSIGNEYLIHLQPDPIRRWSAEFSSQCQFSEHTVSSQAISVLHPYHQFPIHNISSPSSSSVLQRSFPAISSVLQPYFQFPTNEVSSLAIYRQFSSQTVSSPRYQFSTHIISSPAIFSVLSTRQDTHVPAIMPQQTVKLFTYHVVRVYPCVKNKTWWVVIQ